jgi:hypothetical protein
MQQFINSVVYINESNIIILNTFCTIKSYTTLNSYTNKTLIQPKCSKRADNCTNKKQFFRTITVKSNGVFFH